MGDFGLSNKFALFYVSLVSVSLFGSLFASYLDSCSNCLEGNGQLQLDSMSTWMNFTFTWGPGSQKIVQGTLCLNFNICFYTTGSGIYTTRHLLMIVEVNDDEYNGWDYVGIVFDRNQNGYIDTSDYGAFQFFASNMTPPGGVFLAEVGFLGYPEWPLISGFHEASFNITSGYTFYIDFPVKSADWPPYSWLTKEGKNPLHICFKDSDSRNPPHMSAEYVFVRFSFYIPEDW